MLIEQSNLATIVFGPTQYGKSTFIGRLIASSDGGPNPAIGNGNGRSVTRVSKTYSCHRLGLVQDSAGYNDTGLLLPNTAKETAFELAQYPNVDRVRFLVFESLVDSSIQLRATLEKLIEASGEKSKNSIVVVASKLDRADDDELEGRIDSMRQIMAEIGIGERLVTWKNKKCTEDEFAAQLDQLVESLESTPPTRTMELDDINRRVRIRAEELCATQEPKRESRSVEVEQPYVIERIQEVPYTETKMKHVCTSHGHEMLIDRNPAAGIGVYAGTLGVGLLVDGIIKACTQPKYEWVPENVTKHRKETRYDLKTRKVQKELVFESKKPVEDFLLEARKQILNELRASLIAYA